MQKLRYPKILSSDETIETIVNEKKSFARYGDGEIRMMLSSQEEIGFQKKNEALSKRLNEVITHPNENLLIGLPDTFQDISHFTLDSQIFWHGFNYVYARKFLSSIDLTKVYGDATITRFYQAYKNKSQNKIQSKVDKLQTIWDKQKLLIVEGEQTRLGVGNDLFDNSISIKRIVCPSENAFSRYNEILEEIKRIATDELILIALGPTATILAYDLSKEGYWTIDIGHIDIEYSWFKQKAQVKSLVKGKYVQETAAKHNSSEELEDKQYQQSIIKIIKLKATG